MGKCGFFTDDILMEIPRPRLKSLIELNEEEKIAEKAVIAIRRKSSQVDSDLGNIRDEVEAELERLDSQRSNLEEAMRRLLEEQSIVLTALSDLEERQITHKQNLELLKNEEEEIDLERKQLNLALRQLRGGQKTLREMVSKKYSETSKTRINFRDSSNSYLNQRSDLEEMLSLRNSNSNPMRGWASGKNANEEPAIKIVQKNHAPSNSAIQKDSTNFAANSFPAMQESENLQNSENEADLKALEISQSSYAHGNMKKPGMLKRLRLAADKFVPEPFRINKPAIALIEVKIEEAEATQMQESSNLQIQQSKSQIADKKSIGNIQKPNINLEISNFEQKVQNIDAPQSNIKSELSSRLSSLFRKKMPEPSASFTQSPPVLEPSDPEFSPTNTSSPEYSDSSESESSDSSQPLETLQLSNEEPLQEQKPFNAPSMPEVNSKHSNEVEKSPKELLALSIRRQEVQNMSTEAKLERLHSKLLEMKSALSAISGEVPSIEPKANFKPERIVSKPEKIAAVSNISKKPQVLAKPPAFRAKNPPIQAKNPRLQAKKPSFQQKTLPLQAKNPKQIAKAMPKHSTSKKKKK